MDAELVEKTLVFIRCPDCGDDTSHCISPVVKNSPFGPWHCNKCQTAITGFVHADGSVRIEKQRKKIPFPSTLSTGMLIPPIEF